MSIDIFISAVSNEFRDYREQLSRDLTRQNVGVKIQEDFKNHGVVTLDKLDIYIKSCDAVVHLVGDMTGSEAESTSTTAITTKYPDIFDRFPPLLIALDNGFALSYTQWEAWLALYHTKPLVIAKADAAAPRGPKYEPTTFSIAAQKSHLESLREMGRYSESTFTSCDNLAKEIAYSVILDAMVDDRRNSHLAPLADALIDMATMAFVDVMRLTCVAGSDTARSANQARYPEFVDVSAQHLREFDSHLTRIKDYLSLDALKPCQDVISGLNRLPRCYLDQQSALPI